MKNICALIPAYNEEETIGDLVSGLRLKVENVFVVNDGSLDNTAQVAERAGAVVLQHDRCLGKGASLRTGYDYCLSREFTAVLNLDSDGQHDWQDADNFFKAFEETHAGIIIGDRMNDVKDMPWLRYMTNRLTSRIISSLIKQEVNDTQCGYRLIQSEVLKKIKLTTAHFDTESELLIKAGRLGCKIFSVPIKTIYRREKSKINRLVDTCRFIRLIWRSFLWAHK